MIIFGIDPGYGRLGYALFDKSDSKEELIAYSCIETKSKDPHHKRILQIADRVESLLKKYQPSVLVIEKLFFTKNQKTALAVSEIRGLLIYLALKNKIKVVEYTPLEVKTAVCSYGKAPKEQVKKMVQALANIKKPIKYDDTADAIALCLTCLARKDHLTPFTKKNISAKQ